MNLRNLRSGSLFAAAVVASVAAITAPVVPPAGAAPGDPQPVWERRLPGSLIRESSPLLVDLDGDGTRLEVAVGAHDGRVHVLEGTTGANAAGWPQATTNRVNSSPAAADVNGGDGLELFVGSGMAGDRQGAVYSFGPAGGLRFRTIGRDPDFPSGAPFHGATAIGDVTGDRVPEATAGALGVRSLWSFRATDGQPLRGRELYYWDDSMFASPALHDIDGDGVGEVIAAGDSTPGPPVDHRGGMVRAIDGTGRQRWEYRTNDIVRSSPSVGDIDGDGRAEVVFGGGDYYHASDARIVHALDAATGRVKWRAQLDGVAAASPALADVNADGVLDVVIGTFDSAPLGLRGGSVYALSGRDGRPLPGYPVASGGGPVLAGIVTADANGDGAQDLVVSTGAFLALLDGRSGRRLFTFAEGFGVAFQSSAVADVDGDGILDVVAAGSRGGDGRIYRWQLPAAATLGRLGWHQFRRNPERTGSWTTGSHVPLPFRRISGPDRFATAVALSAGAPAGTTVYVATGAAYADALAGGPAAARAGGPMLLVGRDSVPAVTRDRLAALRPRRIVVLGGANAVSDAVVRQLDEMSTEDATRIAGTDRYETAAAIAIDAFTSSPEVAYVAAGGGFADALAGAAAGAARGGPVLLVERDRLPATTEAALQQLRPRQVVVLGGGNAVSEGVVAELREHHQVERIAGVDRYDTAVRLSRTLHPEGSATAYLATGLNFPDALAGGPVAARADAPLLLVAARCTPRSVRDELLRLGVDRVVLLGGAGVLPRTLAQLPSC